MAKQALIEQRPWLLASIAAAGAFYFLRDNPVGEGTWGPAGQMAPAVGLLSVYAWLRVPSDQRGLDGRAAWCWRCCWAAAGDVAYRTLFRGGRSFLHRGPLRRRGALISATRAYATLPAQRMLRPRSARRHAADQFIF